MKTRKIRQTLCQTFGFETWPELKEFLEEAKHPYPVRLTWKDGAKAKAKNGSGCLFWEGIGNDSTVNARYVTEEFTYVRFNGSPKIMRYQNSTEVKAVIREFDATCQLPADFEDGEEFVLEPVGKARSHSYSQKRREAIKNGEWNVKPRGPNPNPRKQPLHHFRPY